MLSGERKLLRHPEIWSGVSLPLPNFLKAREWEAFVVPGANEPVVRVLYSSAGTADGPTFELGLVEIFEGPRAVTVTLYERIERGHNKLAFVMCGVDAVLSESLGERRMVDGTTGRVMPLLHDAGPDYQESIWRRGAARTWPRWKSGDPPRAHDA